MRETGIFTGTTSSPSRSLRQSLYRYAIRAGRNLPDKEFRYLRTVIVTAAVHRGFSSKLLPCGITSPFNLPAPGRRQPLYVVFDFAETCVFVKQSQSAFHCGPLGLLTLAGRPFSRSYGSNLPSSLTSVLSSAFGYSPRLPVSV
jgi:hypothetical protein